MQFFQYVNVLIEGEYGFNYPRLMACDNSGLSDQQIAQYLADYHNVPNHSEPCTVLNNGLYTTYDDKHVGIVKADMNAQYPAGSLIDADSALVKYLMSIVPDIFYDSRTPDAPIPNVARDNDEEINAKSSDAAYYQYQMVNVVNDVEEIDFNYWIFIPCDQGGLTSDNITEFFAEKHSTPSETKVSAYYGKGWHINPIDEAFTTYSPDSCNDKPFIINADSPVAIKLKAAMPDLFY